MDALTFLCFSLNIFLFKLIVACILCVIYVREDNDSIGYDYTACMDYMDPDIRCPKKLLNLITHLIPNSPFGRKWCILSLAIFFPCSALHLTDVCTLDHDRLVDHILSNNRTYILLFSCAFLKCDKEGSFWVFKWVFHWFRIDIFPILFLYFHSRNSYIPIYLKPVIAWRPDVGMAISIIDIRHLWDCLFFIMGIPILVRHLYIETSSCLISQYFRATFTNACDSQAHKPKLVPNMQGNFYVKNYCSIRSQFCTCHDSSVFGL